MEKLIYFVYGFRLFLFLAWLAFLFTAGWALWVHSLSISFVLLMFIIFAWLLIMTFGG